MLRTLFKDYSILFVVRIFSKVIDFLLKLSVIRSIDPNIFASTVHFELIKNMALFYTKNCLRNSYQKRAEGLSLRDMTTSASNLMLLGVPICFVVACFMVGAQFFFHESDLKYFHLASALYGISAVFESFSQVLVTKLVLLMDYQSIGKYEIKSLLCRSSVLTLAVLTGQFSTYGVLIFGVSQLVYSATMLFFIYVSIQDQSDQYQLLRKIPCEPQPLFVHPNMSKAAKEFTLVSIVKLFLQQLQKIVLVLFNISALSSDFTLINNLGSIIPKYLFTPLQEIGYNIFSKEKSKEQNHNTLITLYRILIIFGMLVTVFGFCYAQNLLLLLVGESWTTSSTVNSLRIYSFYVFTMGVNGLSQAFVYAKINPEDIGQFRKYMFGTTLIYLTACITFIKLGYGAPGIFVACSLSMMFRISICWKVYIRKEVFSSQSALRSLLPQRLIMAAYLLSLLVCNQIKNLTTIPLVNLMIGGAIFLMNLALTVYKEKDIIVKYKKMQSAKKE